MATYKVTVATGTLLHAGTFDNIYITLVGNQGQSEKTWLNNYGKDFYPGAIDVYNLTCHKDLGELILVKLTKEKYAFFPEDDWYCQFVSVETPTGEKYHFPCYRWISGYTSVELREGKGKKVYDDTLSSLQKHRKEELEIKRQMYQWKTFQEGVPRCIKANSIDDLNPDIRYTFTREVSFLLTSKTALVELKLKGFTECKEPWKNLEDISRVFWFNRTPISEYVSSCWKDDAFFGYQYLNGANPIWIKQCKKIPPNFPVTQDMVAPILGSSTTLQKEMQKENIFIADYQILEGVPTNTVNNRQQFIAAPLCLLYKNEANELVPIAIQLKQEPGSENPIFLPSDSECDWLLAKIWVRNSDFHVHQLISHFLRTHTLAEVFCIAMIRQLPTCHPLYKLLVPHMRYTLHINTLARERLIGEGGIFDRISATGKGGHVVLLQKALQNLNYNSLCVPDDLKSRGVEGLQNYYYKEDGLKIWSAIESFVAGIVHHYYENDSSVEQDTELQCWVAEIFKDGFLGRESSGIPSSFSTKLDLIKFLTMVIWTCSAQHAAVNNGQFDFLSWMPNAPSTMQNPPPTKKGKATMDSILRTLPDVNVTCSAMTALWLLSRPSRDPLPLGTYPDEHFTEDVSKTFIENFQKKLNQIQVEIDKRNNSLLLQYEYLRPAQIECSVAV